MGPRELLVNRLQPAVQTVRAIFAATQAPQLEPEAVTQVEPVYLEPVHAGMTPPERQVLLASKPSDFPPKTPAVEHDPFGMFAVEAGDDSEAAALYETCESMYARYILANPQPAPRRRDRNKPLKVNLPSVQVGDDFAYNMSAITEKGNVRYSFQLVGDDDSNGFTISRYSDRAAVISHAVDKETGEWDKDAHVFDTDGYRGLLHTAARFVEDYGTFAALTFRRGDAPEKVRQIPQALGHSMLADIRPAAVTIRDCFIPEGGLRVRHVVGSILAGVIIIPSGVSMSRYFAPPGVEPPVIIGMGWTNTISDGVHLVTGGVHPVTGKIKGILHPTGYEPQVASAGDVRGDENLPPRKVCPGPDC